jgi:molybdate transport system substrate-binding protein
MKFRAFVNTTAGAVLLLASTLGAGAAEIRVLSAPAVRPVLTELAPMFERTSGHRLAIQFMFAPELKRRLDAGEPFDLAIYTPAVIEDVIKQGRITAGTRVDIARTGMGVAVRAGATKPDISSAEMFRSALRNASSIAYAGDGTSGAYFMGLVDRLGLADELKPKLKPSSGNPLSAVLSGEAEIAILNIPPILDERGAALVGPLPAELQNWIGYAAGIGAVSREVSAGRELIRFLTSEAAASVLKSKGMEPAASP